MKNYDDLSNEYMNLTDSTLIDDLQYFSEPFCIDYDIPPDYDVRCPMCGASNPKYIIVPCDDPEYPVGCEHCITEVQQRFSAYDGDIYECPHCGNDALKLYASIRDYKEYAFCKKCMQYFDRYDYQDYFNYCLKKRDEEGEYDGWRI